MQNALKWQHLNTAIFLILLDLFWPYCCEFLAERFYLKTIEGGEVQRNPTPKTISISGCSSCKVGIRVCKIEALSCSPVW